MPAPTARFLPPPPAHSKEGPAKGQQKPVTKLKPQNPELHKKALEKLNEIFKNIDELLQEIDATDGLTEKKLIAQNISRALAQSKNLVTIFDVDSQDFLILAGQIIDKSALYSACAKRLLTGFHPDKFRNQAYLKLKLKALQDTDLTPIVDSLIANRDYYLDKLAAQQEKARGKD